MLPQTSTERAITILLVDDHRELRESLRELLDFEPGLRVVGVARSGAEGVALALEHRPDVILMNYSMPEMDGLEAIRRIKARLPDASILMLSAFDPPELIAAAFDAGAAGFFLKPIVRMDEFLDSIHFLGKLVRRRPATAR